MYGKLILASYIKQEALSRPVSNTKEQKSVVMLDNLMKASAQCLAILKKAN